MAGCWWFEKKHLINTQAYPESGQHVVCSHPQPPRIAANSFLEATPVSAAIRGLGTAGYTQLEPLKRILIGIIAACIVTDVSYAADSAVDVHSLSLKAREGDSAARYDLANAYLTGAGLPKNPKRALSWLNQSATDGNVSAQLLLAHLYYTGLHTNKNTDLAITWWQRAAENDNADGQYKLATVLLNRSANDKDIETANELLLTAWRKGHQQAGNLLVSLGQELPQTPLVGNETDDARSPKSTPTTSTIATLTDAARPKSSHDEVAHNQIDSDSTSNDSNNSDNDVNPIPINNLSQHDDWIFSQPPNNYTIQLASFNDPNARDLFLQRNSLQGNNQLKTIRSADNQWTYVLLGTYPNGNAASQEAVGISTNLEPWIRSFSSIQRNRCAQLKVATPDQHAKHCQQFN